MATKNFVFCFALRSVFTIFVAVMSTIIYPSPIFGPVHSRRLGLSLGINLMPGDGKICTFDCIYCECGLNGSHHPKLARPTREKVRDCLREMLTTMAMRDEHPDVLTFAGNGEPTAHPDFAGIIDDTIALRDELAPQAKVSVLSNSTFIHRDTVRQALLKVDNNILKLDTVDADYIRRVDRPTSRHYDVEKIVENMRLFDGHVVIQTMFMKGMTDGGSVDNTSDRYVLPWLSALKRISPREVMIYTIDRETPYAGLEKASHAELDRIRDLVVAEGIACTASY